MSKTDEKKKKGVLSAIWESMTKTGGCCGGGESCGCGPKPDKDKAKPEKKNEKQDSSSCSDSCQCKK
ncbi:MAG: hypothetical protein WAX69_26645 [Victivallales bacterium]